MNTRKGVQFTFKKNGEKLYIEYKSALVRPETREPFISGIGRDITERILSEDKVEKLKEQVIQSQKNGIHRNFSRRDCP